MGLNLLRFATDPQYRAVKQFRFAGGDAGLRYNYPLTPHDVVIDLGAYHGEFAVNIAQKFGATVHAFEPVPDYANIARAAAKDYPSVYVYSYGLAKSTVRAAITIDGLASSRGTAGPTAIEAEFRSAVSVLDALAPGPIALMKLNVEGDEYEILLALIEAGALNRVTDLQVQFHLFQPDARERYRALAAQLARTHRLSWRYPFIWENWHRLNGH